MISVILDGKLTSRLDFAVPRHEALMGIAKGEKILWELDLGPFSNHPFEAQSRLLAIDHFLKTLWKEFKDYTYGLSLYRGSLDIDLPLFSEHLKFLTMTIPDALPLFLHFDEPPLPPLELARRTSRALFPRFEIRFDGEPLPFRSWESKVGFLIPSKADRTFEGLLSQGIDPRVITEDYLTAEWDGLDILYVDSSCLSREGHRKVQGFLAAGGEVVYCDNFKECKS